MRLSVELERDSRRKKRREKRVSIEGGKEGEKRKWENRKGEGNFGSGK
jgi:hypothetical protein